MNKTAITMGYFALGAVAIIVVSLIAIFRPDATATIMQFVGTVLGIAFTGAVTFHLLGKQNEKLEKVEKQTNGTLSALTEENARLTKELVEASRKLQP